MRRGSRRARNCPRRGNVSAKTARLRLRRAIVIEIIEAGLSERHNFRMPRQRHKLIGANPVLLVGVMRMGADRAIDVVVFVGDREQPTQPAHPRRDRDHAADPGLGRPRDDGVEIGRKIREIQMAMAVDEHTKILKQPSAR